VSDRESGGGPDRRELRNFGISLGVVCLIWAGILAWRGHGGAVPWLMGAAPILIALGLAVPRALAPLHRVWMPAARGLAHALTWILLTTVYYLVFTPFGVIRSLLGKDSLDRKWEPDRESYWIERHDGPFDPERTKRQY
jgi:formate hydrogenlyase subunit 3/multisubunit Na+/H+ antiporter MnhD subunit